MNATALELSIESKFVLNREGSSLRTSDELQEVMILDACALLNVDAPELPVEDESNEDELDALDLLSELLNELREEYEGKLSEAGYTVVWNDGYVIYKDLTDEESEAISYV